MSTFRPLVEIAETASNDVQHQLHLCHKAPTTEVAHVLRIKNSWSLSRERRLFDIAVSLVVLAIVSVPLLLIIVCMRLGSKGPAIFVQKRVGQGGRLFSIYKLRTMKADAAANGMGLTRGGDTRVTWIGKWLRKLKLDELPQFYNVLRGDMSIVGPRPKLPQYAEEVNLAYRPGITGAASLAFHNEEEMLASIPAEEVEAFYQNRIKPLKASIDSRYMLHATLQSDVRMILATFVKSLRPDESPEIDLGMTDLGPTEILQARESTASV